MTRLLFALMLFPAVLLTAQSYHNAPPEGKIAGIPPKAWVEKIDRLAPAQATAKPAKNRTVLMFSLTTGYQHSVSPYASEVIKVLAKKTGAFTVVESSDIECFSPENLSKFDAVVLNNNCPQSPDRDIFLDVLNNKATGDKTIGSKYEDLTPQQRKQKAAELEQNLLDFVSSGKGLVSLHGSIAMQNNSAEFSKMMGGSFDFHPPRQELTLELVDPDHPLVTAFNGQGFIHSDELYLFKNEYAKTNFRPLLEAMFDKLDEKSRNNKRISQKGRLYVSWIKRYGNGRVFFVSPSHQPESYETQCMLRFYLDGIQYALGDLSCEDSPL
ncbi:Trehalose utilization [Planctomycetes bacterium CA13]|uniref:Trehalose utilization n=1 Tax=Novipirellula herctigrandis TaxID=2527986 RepID=A0A5C5ZCJ2_9BACT|nr:Trehalose utilization [Planctomycetes bacterium CA13]